MFLNPDIFSNMNSNGSDLLDMRNLQEQVKKAEYRLDYRTRAIITRGLYILKPTF